MEFGERVKHVVDWPMAEAQPFGYLLSQIFESNLQARRGETHKVVPAGLSALICESLQRKHGISQRGTPVLGIKEEQCGEMDQIRSQGNNLFRQAREHHVHSG